MNEGLSKDTDALFWFREVELLERGVRRWPSGGGEDVVSVQKDVIYLPVPATRPHLVLELDFGRTMRLGELEYMREGVALDWTQVRRDPFLERNRSLDLMHNRGRVEPSC
jgi:hypothetical protein